MPICNIIAPWSPKQLQPLILVLPIIPRLCLFVTIFSASKSVTSNLCLLNKWLLDGWIHVSIILRQTTYCLKRCKLDQTREPRCARHAYYFIADFNNLHPSPPRDLSFILSLSVSQVFAYLLYHFSIFHFIDLYFLLVHFLSSFGFILTFLSKTKKFKVGT